MPGLINSHRYEASKASLSASVAGAERALDAAEWVLMHAPDFGAFELVKQTPRGPVRAYRAPATEKTPSIVIVFGFENHGGEEKVLVIDAMIHEEESNG